MQLVGQTLSHFRILAKLGEGGMGEVYRAEDLQLKRAVALKVLPPELAGSQERLTRFQREAEAIAALDHPNIVTIFSVEEDEGVHFLTMQLVEGRTLSECIPRHGMALDDFFEVAIPLADAIGAAHEKGIIHRDLKPPNIMLADDGRVKILDFGLAKLRQKAARSVEASELPTQALGAEELTGEERILGTAAYMSPEQAQGRAVDHRSDIFSLSIILYQMATGEHPFKGDSNMSRISAILKDTPSSVIDLRPSLPRHLGRIVRHGLEKDVKLRYQAVLDLRNDLAELAREVESGEVLTTGASRPVRFGWRRAVRPALWIGVALVAALGVAGWLNSSRTSAPAEAPVRTVPLTAWPGSEIDPALSPSGEHLAFAWDGESPGRFDLYVMLPGSGGPLRLTEGTGDVRHPAWSPDGLEIAFLQPTEPTGHNVVVVPALGGLERLLGSVAHLGFPGLDWSPDGRWLALVDRPAADAPEGIFLLSTETGEKRQLTTPPSSGIGDRDPAFSPDGRSLAFVRWHEAPHNEVYLVGLDGGEPEQLLVHGGWIRGLDWSADGSSLIFSSTWQGSGGIWHLSLTGDLEQLSVGENARGLSVGPEGRMVFSKAFPDTNLWRANGPSGGAVSPQRLVASTREEWGAQFSPDGRRIAFTSDRSGPFHIWLCDSEGEQPFRLTTDGEATSIHPRWSPDSRQIAFGRETEGNLDVWVIEAEGGFARRLTDSAAMDGASGWSRDGRWIYFFSDRSGTYEVWRVLAAGGEPQQITRQGGVLPAESADGRFVYYLKQTAPYSIWKVPVEGGEESLVLERKGLSVSGFDVWSAPGWGESLVFLLRGVEGGPRIERLELASGEIEVVARLGASTRVGKYGRISVSSDGQWVLYPQDDSPGSDLILVEGLAATGER